MRVIYGVLSNRQYFQALGDGAEVAGGNVDIFEHALGVVEVGEVEFEHLEEVGLGGRKGLSHGEF
jgi:hypothetical protein